MSLAFDVVVDASGLSCPWPLLKLRRALDLEAPEGAVVKVIATDPGAHRDVEVFCKRTGHALLHVERGAQAASFFVRKSRAREVPRRRAR